MNGESCLQEDHDKKDKVLKSNRKEESFDTEEPRYNKPRNNEVLGITNDFPYPSNRKIYENQLRYNKTSL